METTNKKEVNAMIFNELIQQAEREEAENNKMALSISPSPTAEYKSRARREAEQNERIQKNY